jgi:hypothetical protein
MAEPLNSPRAAIRSHQAERHRARRCGRRATARSGELEALGVLLHRVPSPAQAGRALQALPRIDAILIDAASGLARSGCIVATPARPRPYPGRAPQ